jgi:hypothetical protein
LWGPVDLEASFVHDHLMAVPAEEDEIVLIGSAPFRPGDDVVSLEPVSAGASVCGADPEILV